MKQLFAVFALFVLIGVAACGEDRQPPVKTLTLYLATTAVAIVIGLALGNMVQPGVAVDRKSVV